MYSILIISSTGSNNPYNTRRVFEQLDTSITPPYHVYFVQTKADIDKVPLAEIDKLAAILSNYRSISSAEFFLLNAVAQALMDSYKDGVVKKDLTALLL